MDDLGIPSDEVPDSTPHPNHDLTGRIIDEVRVERVISTHHYGKRWLCTCLACGRTFSKYTAQINIVLNTGARFSCAACKRELLQGLHADKSGNRKRAYLNLWETHHTLYPLRYEDRLADELRADFESLGGSPYRDDVSEALGPQSCTPQHPPTDPHPRYIQNIYALFPMFDEDLAHLCVYCNLYYQLGFACVSCGNFVCVACVRSDSKHLCETHDDDSATLSDIGDAFGRSRERIRQMEYTILTRMRMALTDLTDKEQEAVWDHRCKMRDIVDPDYTARINRSGHGVVIGRNERK